MRATTSVFSFFSGAGFLDLGFEQAGFNISFVNEVYPHFSTRIVIQGGCWALKNQNMVIISAVLRNS